MTDDQVGFSQATKNRANKKEYVVDWPSLFGTDTELKRSILIQRLYTTHDMPYGTADAYINDELVKVTGKTGFYRMKGNNKPKDESGPTFEPDKPEPGSDTGSDNSEL